MERVDRLIQLAGETIGSPFDIGTIKVKIAFNIDKNVFH